MRLLLAHPYTSWTGVHRGGERYLDDLVAWAAGAGHDVHVATVRRSGRAEDEHAGARVHELDVAPGPGADERFGTAVEALLARSRRSGGGRFDLVHALEAPAALGAAAAGVPVVFSVLGLPRGEWLARRPSYRRQLQEAAAAVDVLCGLTRAAADAVAAVTGTEVAVLPPGVRTAAFPLDPAPRDGRTVLFVGADEPRKRFAELVAALEDVPGARLVAVGPKDPEPVLRRHPAVAGRVTVLTLDDPTRLPELYARAAVTAVPAVDEAFGLVVVESLACGTPVLAAPGSGPAEILGDAPVGRVTDDLAAGLRDLLARSHDPATCRAHALAWDWASVGPAHDDVWAAALRAGARANRAVR